MNKKIYEAELPHRAVAVYLYLKDRANKEGTLGAGGIAQGISALMGRECLAALRINRGKKEFDGWQGDCFGFVFFMKTRNVGFQ